MQQPPLFGKQRRDLLQNLPVALVLDPRLRLREVGQVHRKPADHRAGGVVQLDARGQALGGQAGPRPHHEGGVNRRRAGHRRIAGAHERVERFDAIDLLECALQLGPHILPLVQHLRRVAGFDQLLSRSQRGIDEGRVEHQRRQRDRQERQQQAGGLRAMPHHRRIAAHHPRGGGGKHNHRNRRPRRSAIGDQRWKEEDRRRQEPRHRAANPPP